MNQGNLPIAIYYEHSDWFRPLFAELDRRGLNYVRLDARCHRYDVADTSRQYALLFNRMSASASLRGNEQGLFFTRDFLSHCERNGTRVINGRAAFELEISKASQLSLLRSLNLDFPRSQVINCAAEAIAASRELGFPLMVKPNIGGRGAGIVRFENADVLQSAIDTGQIDLGIDRTALVQEYVPARGGHIHRVETLGGKFLYAMKVFTTGENFNLCPAEICQVEAAATCLVDGPKAGLKVEAFTPPNEIIAAIEQIVAAAQIDVGGVEYIVDERDGRLLYYDINALSNFIADAPRVIGFDPHARLVDFLETQMEVA